MYVTYQDLIQIGILVVALANLIVPVRFIVASEICA